MATNFTINADSTPVYDGWGWADYWQCDDWINWHKAMVVKYGDKVADERWANAWLDGLSTLSGGYGKASGTSIIGNDAVPVNCRTSPFFADYISKRPIMKTAVYAGVGGFIGGVVEGGMKAVNTAGELLSGTASGLGWVGRNLKWIIPVITLTALGFVGYKIYKEIK